MKLPLLLCLALADCQAAAVCPYERPAAVPTEQPAQPTRSPGPAFRNDAGAECWECWGVEYCCSEPRP